MFINFSVEINSHVVFAQHLAQSLALISVAMLMCRYRYLAFNTFVISLPAFRHNIPKFMLLFWEQIT